MALVIQDGSGNSYDLSVNATDQSLVLTPAPGITPSPGIANSITVSALSLINAALQELGVLAAGEAASLNDQAWVLQKLQRLIDRYNARMAMVYATTFSTFALVPGLSPHTIGPSGSTFQVNQRPVDIPTIGLLLLSSSPLTEVPMNRRDRAWWASVQVKTLTSTFPTDYYYEPDWPAGNIFFWPVPTQVNNVLVQQRTVLGQITSYAQSFSMPPAYWDAIVYPLAISLCPSFERPATPELKQLAVESLKAIQGNNLKSPRGSTADSGMPGAGRKGGFNWLTGQGA